MSDRERALEAALRRFIDYEEKGRDRLAPLLRQAREALAMQSPAPPRGSTSTPSAES